MRRIAAMTVLASSVALGSTLTPEDFEYRIALTTERPEGLHSLEPGERALRFSSAPDLRDLRVFNANGEALPMATLPPLAPAAVERGPVIAVRIVPLPPAPQARDRVLADFALRLERDGRHTVLELHPGGGSEAAAALPDPGGYLMDLRPLKDKVGELSLQFAATAPDYAGQIEILGSDDLVGWRRIGDGPLARNRSLGDAVERATFDLVRPTAFARISWPSGAAPQLAGAGFVERLPAIPPPLPRASLTLVASGEGGWTADLPPGLPMTRIVLHAPQTNQSLRVNIHCRTDQPARDARVRHLRELAVREAPSPWSLCLPGVEVYKVDRDGHWIENAPVALQQRPAQLRLEVVDPKDYSGTPPAVELEWAPVRIAFLARAPGPFRLAVGRTGADYGPRLDIAALLASDDRSGAKLPAARIAREKEGAAGGAAQGKARSADIDLRWRIALWSALLVAVLALAGMAWRLARRMSASDER